MAKKINLNPQLKRLDTSLLRATKIRRHERIHPSMPDQRVVIHVQTKNKHPHSTKKHK